MRACQNVGSREQLLVVGEADPDRWPDDVVVGEASSRRRR